MTPKTTLISYDLSVYNDLIVLIGVLCLGMVACSCWLAYQKSSWRFQVSAWSGFLLLLLLGSLGLCTFIYAQRLIWRDTCAKLVASYANMIGQLDHWKIGGFRFLLGVVFSFFCCLVLWGSARSFTPND